MMTRCPHCGGVLTPPVPPTGCKCDPMEWGDPYNIPPACSEFCPDKFGSCACCEHDQACHDQPKD